ncbi:XK-related protein 9-like [Saccostrea cucullata]|uniref:XK-related protein 9-like n=1 Tax=Saccostrea cuccullata TaxID=36930 RepID=UPI002ED282F2
MDTMTNQLYPFTCMDLCLNVFSVFLFCVDVFTDIWLAKSYYEDGMTLECILTASVVVAAFIVTGILGSIWLRDKSDPKRPPRPFILLILTFPFATIESNITYIYHGYKSRKKGSDRHFREMINSNMNATLLRMFDAFIESAPQLLLQVYLILKEQENLKDCEDMSIRSLSDIIRLLTVLSSWISVAWSATAFYRAHRLENDSAVHKTRLKTVFAAMGYFLWRAFEIGPRVMALVMMFLMNGIIFAITLTFHWIVMVTWSIATKIRPYLKTHQNVIFSLFVGFVQIFSFMNVSRFKFPDHAVIINPVDSSVHAEEVNPLESSDHAEEVNRLESSDHAEEVNPLESSDHAEEVNPLESSDHAEEVNPVKSSCLAKKVNPHDDCYPIKPRHHALLYYLFVYTENIVILILWILVKNNSFCPWIYHGSIGIVCSGLICNIVFMISYYKVCHPTTSICE